MPGARLLGAARARLGHDRLPDVDEPRSEHDQVLACGLWLGLPLTGIDQLRRAGMNVDVQEMEAVALLRRRQNQDAPDKGGWSAFFGLIDRSLANTNPFGSIAIRADGLAAWDGWPTSASVEALRAAWLDAGDLDGQRRTCTELQLQLWQDVPYIPMGEYWQSTAYRKDLLDVLPGCFPVFWGIRRA